METMKTILRRYKSVLAASAAVAFLFMATHTAQADQYDFSNGAVLTYSVSDGGGNQCGAGGEKLYYYAFTVESYTSSPGTGSIVTNFDSSGGDWLYTVPSGGCSDNDPPMGASPAQTQFNLPGGSYILFYPGDGYGSASCFENGGNGC